MRTIPRLAAPLLATCVLVAPASATTLIALGEGEMARSADLIVAARCIDTRSAWIGRELYTLSVFEVDETLKGGATGRVTVVVPGGSDASHRPPIARIYPGAPHFAPERDVLLFLERSPLVARGYRVSGFSQGAYFVVPGPQGPLVSRELSALRFVGPAPRAAPMLLDELRARIRRHLAE